MRQAEDRDGNVGHRYDLAKPFTHVMMRLRKLEPIMKPIISAFEASPDEGQGLARDMRVRWALEEVGQPYDVNLVSFEEMKRPAYLAMQPFGQIPVYQEGNLTLFESGAIILHIAETHTGLLPTDASARSLAITWIFAALNTVEPPIVNLEAAMLMERDKPWYSARLPLIEEQIHDRLKRLTARLGDADWFDGEFTAGDLMMVMVLRRLDGTDIIERYPALAAYVARGEARPAYQRAFADQRAVFTSGKTGRPI